MPEERIPKLIMDWIPRERRKRGRPRKTWMEGVSTSRHDNKKFRTRSMEKQWNGVWFPEDGDSC